MIQRPIINGDCHPRFLDVKLAFQEGFQKRDEIGAAVSLVVGGETVVDLWGGYRNRSRSRLWARDTLANVYSVTKGMTAICAHRLIERGRIDLDAPVAHYWPEFAQKGKADLPVRWLLSHRAGLAAVAEPLPSDALYDWGAMTRALAAQRPWWEPGTTHGYHALSFGWLVGELVRRVTGKSLGTYFREEIAEPLGLDFYIGLPLREHSRAAEIVFMAPTEEPGMVTLSQLISADPNGMTARAFMNPPSMAFEPNLPEWRRAEIPAANGHGTARSVARAFAALAMDGVLDGVPVLGGEGITRCWTVQSRGADAVLKVSTCFSLGFMVSQGDVPEAAFGPNPRTFGHPGAGGALGFADPQAGIGFGYVTNHLGRHILLDPRAMALVDAVYGALRE